MMNTVATRPFVLVVTVLILTHGLPAFSIPSRMIPGGVVTAHVVSIAAVYSPRRAARLHLAR